MNVTTATPTQIDTRLAELYRQAGSAEAKVLAAAVNIHYALGEKPEYITRTRKAWPTTDAAAVAAARARGDERIPRSGGGYTYADMVAKYDAAAAALDAIKAEAAPLNAEYARRPWSRFFVVQNNGGHIHSSMNCSTCNRGLYATQFGWNPELSGLSEAEALATFDKRAHVLCTVCFPNAPVEWRTADKKPGQCDGSRKAPIEGSTKKTGMRRYGDCTKCTDRPLINGDGTVRAHKPKEPREQAAPQAPAVEAAPAVDAPAAPAAPATLPDTTPRQENPAMLLPTIPTTLAELDEAVTRYSHAAYDPESTDDMREAAIAVANVATTGILGHQVADLLAAIADRRAGGMPAGEVLDQVVDALTRLAGTKPEPPAPAIAAIEYPNDTDPFTAVTLHVPGQAPRRIEIPARVHGCCLFGAEGGKGCRLGPHRIGVALRDAGYRQVADETPTARAESIVIEPIEATSGQQRAAIARRSEILWPDPDARPTY